MDETLEISEKLQNFQEEHAKLDKLIVNEAHLGQLHIQRLKKRKLWLKDEIAHLNALLYPDIIA